MRKFTQFLMISIFASSMLFSQEHDSSGRSAGSRQMSIESRAMWELSQQNQANENSSSDERSHAGFFWDTIPTPVHALHWISELAYLSDTLVMEDGSVWHINSADRNTLKNWKTSDSLVITQAGWFAGARYKIINKKDSSSVDANLSLGSIIDGQYSHKIVAIDMNRGEVILENGWRWNISYSDRNQLAEWLESDTIIVGVNTSYFSGGEFLLIDVEANNNVKANLIQIQNPYVSHWVSELAALSDTLVMEDGSIWRINPSDRSLLNTWKTNDPIVLTQSSYFSGYTYKIMNKGTNTTVAANLSLGSVIGGRYSHRIVEINPFTGELFLENGSRWMVSSDDLVLLREWRNSDTIITGANTRYFSKGEFILIDVEMNNYVKANLIP